MTQGILIITGFNVSFYVSVKSGISLGFKLVYWVTVHLQHRYKCSLICGIKGPKLFLQVQVSCSQEEQRNCFFFFYIENRQASCHSWLHFVEGEAVSLKDAPRNVPFTSHHFRFQSYTSCSKQDSGTY